jgi:hypothetical protein
MTKEGPRFVLRVKSDYVFVEENLYEKELKAAHATHLQFYQDMELNVTVSGRLEKRPRTRTVRGVQDTQRSQQ